MCMATVKQLSLLLLCRTGCRCKRDEQRCTISLHFNATNLPVNLEQTRARNKFVSSCSAAVKRLSIFSVMFDTFFPSDHRQMDERPTAIILETNRVEMVLLARSRHITLQIFATVGTRLRSGTI